MRKEKTQEYNIQFLGSGIPMIDISEVGDEDSVSSDMSSNLNGDEDRLSVSNLDIDRINA